MGILIAYLLGVITAIQRKDHNRKNIDTETANNSRKSSPDFPVPIVSIPPTPTDQEGSKQEQAKGRDWIKVLIEMTALLILGFYAGFIIAGWRKGKDSITPLVFLLIAYFLGRFKAWQYKGSKREHVVSVQEQTERRGTIKFWVEIAGVILLAIYAGFTIATWHVSNQQLTAMKGRAWVQIETNEITLKDFPKFSLIGDPRDRPGDGSLIPGEPERPYPGIIMETIQFPIKIRNFGNVPARQSYINGSILIYAHMPEDAIWGSQFPDDDWNRYACDEATFFRIHSPGLETPIFPGEYEHTIYARRDIPIAAKEISNYAIVVCVAYEDATTGDVHRTAVAYCPKDTDWNRREHVIDHATGVDGHQKKYSADLWWQAPTKQFTRCRADAD